MYVLSNGPFSYVYGVELLLKYTWLTFRLFFLLFYCFTYICYVGLLCFYVVVIETIRIGGVWRRAFKVIKKKSLDGKAKRDFIVKIKVWRKWEWGGSGAYCWRRFCKAISIWRELGSSALIVRVLLNPSGGVESWMWDNRRFHCK